MQQGEARGARNGTRSSRWGLQLLCGSGGILPAEAVGRDLLARRVSTESWPGLREGETRGADGALAERHGAASRFPDCGAGRIVPFPATRIEGGKHGEARLRDLCQASGAEASQFGHQDEIDAIWISQGAYGGDGQWKLWPSTQTGRESVQRV